jgi:trehalose synthase
VIERVEIREEIGLEDYASAIHLMGAVHALRTDAEALVPRLRGRRVWMVNSTSRGGGVAEMMPKLVSLLRELGVEIEWVVAGTAQPKFFDLTKRLHNLIHGQGDPRLSPDDRALYEAVSRENAELMESLMSRDDILVIHDPQPLGMGALLKRELGIPTIFRCHIGVDEDLPQTRAAWEFLRPFAEICDFAVFSALEYVPDFLAGRACIIHPAIDPMSFKNRELSSRRLVGILCNARLGVEHHPVVPRPFEECATRLGPDGRFTPADRDGGIGLLYRPIVTQISRWDRLKGFKPLLDGFVLLKQRVAADGANYSEWQRRRLAVMRLVLAGPDPEAVADDPEGQEVLGELIETYRGLSPELQEDVALLSLPMSSRRENELMVNALQRGSSIVVQNSLREGFGLTVTEAMWKRAAVVGSRACGIRQQICDDIEGRLISDPEDPEVIAAVLDRTLDDVRGRAQLGQNAQRRVHDEFLVFHQVRRWLQVLCDQVGESVA